MGLVLTTAPAVEPITASELKLHSRIDTDADDARIATMITAARQYIENITGHQAITATYTLSMDGFPTSDFIELPYSPLQSVTSVTYYDTSNASTVFSSGSYVVDKPHDAYGRIYVDRSIGWPSTYDRRNSVVIVYKSGYGDTSGSTPERIKQAIYLLAAHWYENREASVIGVSVADLPHGVKDLISNIKIRGGINVYASRIATP